MAVPSSQPQWLQLDTLLQAWLAERQQLHSLLQQLSTVTPHAAQGGHHPELLQPFCQLLMDYISAGYFEVYQQLVNQADQRNPRCSSQARQILAQLDDSTDLALAFNEAFDSSPQGRFGRDELVYRMAQLALALEQRFALEDQLILSIQPLAAVRRQ